MQQQPTITSTRGRRGRQPLTLAAHASTEQVSRKSSDEVDLAGDEHTEPALLEAVRSRVFHYHHGEGA